MTNLKILIIEDDKWYREFLKYHLELNPDYEVTAVERGDKLVELLKQGFDLVCLDFKLPGKTGSEVLEVIKRLSPETEVIIISGQEDVETAVGLLKEGAYDYIVKNDDTADRLWNSILKIREHLELKNEVKTLRKEVKTKYTNNSSLIGESKEISKLKLLIAKAAETNINVSITGETGTGKEVVAKSIHHLSDLKGKFVAVNVAAIPKELIESELFGHEKGAFTGANSRRIGKFEEAQNGTLFLDEIGELDTSLQAKLLRVLQEKEITRVGGNDSIKIQTRIITATHRDLSALIKEGEFREDLYYRLLGLPINIAPLRDRGEDIFILADHFIKEFCASNSLETKKLSQEAREKLSIYPFPGNVRELKALVELSVVMADSDTIGKDDINLMGNSDSLDSLMKMNKSLKEFIAIIVQHFVNKYDKNVVEAAKALDIGKSTIYRMIKAGEVEL